MLYFDILDKNKIKVGSRYRRACLLQLPIHLQENKINSPEKWKYIRYTLSTTEKKAKPYIDQWSKVLFFGDYLKDGSFNKQGQFIIDLDCSVIPVFELNSILNVLRYWDEGFIFENIKFMSLIEDNPQWTTKDFMQTFLSYSYASFGIGAGHSLFRNTTEYDNCSFESLIQVPQHNPLLDRENPDFFTFGPELPMEGYGGKLWSYYEPSNISKVK